EAYREEKYGKQIADAPEVIPRPATRNPTRVVPTVPVAAAEPPPAAAPGLPTTTPQRRPVAPPPPQTPTPQRPTPPENGEVLGSAPHHPAVARQVAAAQRAPRLLTGAYNLPPPPGR